MHHGFPEYSFQLQKSFKIPQMGELGVFSASGEWKGKVKMMF